jgi:gamma-glutamyltranspeptidase/glutathione hydrolase
MTTRRGCVASGHPLVTDAAVEILSAGGNAFDAAVAAGFASAMAEPCLTSLGGGGFLLARTAGGDETLFDFFVDTPGRGRSGVALDPHFLPVTVHFPGSDQVFNSGLGSVAVPGNLAGYLHVHRRLGRLGLRRVLAPAIRLARHGAALSAHQAYFLRLLGPIMRLTGGGRRLFAPTGEVLGEGEVLVNEDLACFLEGLPDGGAHEFYEGAPAASIASDMRARDGLLTAEDLASYRVVERAPLAMTYRGHRVLTNPLPALGGHLVGLSLTLLDAQDVPSSGFASGEHLRALVAVMAEVERLRAEGCLATANAGEIEAGGERVRCSRGTTHVSVADAGGNVASMTTSNGEGSGYVVAGTGIMLNNMMGEDDLHPEGFHTRPPGERVSSMMAPTVILDPAGVRLVIGSGGSKRIRTALVQVISAVVQFGASIRAAVEAPRVHWDGDVVQAEPGLRAEALAALRRTWEVNVWPHPNLYFGGVNAVEIGTQGLATGAGDPRRGGHAAG